MQKKLTVKEILECKGSKKLAEVYTHNAREAEACELAGIQMIISSENNDTNSKGIVTNIPANNGLLWLAKYVEPDNIIPPIINLYISVWNTV